jgi:predicted AlkP superfamily pyrophosphatase or phosphodiesterase
VVYLANGAADASFVYFGAADEVAHRLGPLSPEYRDALRTIDRQIGELMAAVRARPTYDREDWLVLMTSDHGHRDRGGHGRESLEERRVFYLASGPAAVRGRPPESPNVVDVAATALAHMGLRIEPAWRLDGKVVGLQPAASADGER